MKLAKDDRIPRRVRDRNLKANGHGWKAEAIAVGTSENGFRAKEPIVYGAT